MEYFYPTSIGREYAAKTAIGKILKITKGKFGDGIRTTETISELTDLINPLGELPISKKSSKGNTVTITTQFSNFVNDAILPTFYLSEVGLFGKIVNEDGSDDPEYPETMLGYAFDNPGDKIEGVLTEFILNFPITVTDVANVSVSVSSMAYVTQEDFDELLDRTDKHIANKNNPHSVTKAQIGLGNVNNTSDADKPLSNAAVNENYFPEYSADKIDENTKFYIDIADMGYGVGIYKQNVRGIKNHSTYWRDLVSNHSFTLSEINYNDNTQGIITDGTELKTELSDYLCFNETGNVTIAFSARVPHTAESNDLFTFGGRRTLAIQQRGGYGIRILTFDKENTMCTYPYSEDGYYIAPNSFDEYHHYAIVFDTENLTVTWYQDGVLVNTSDFINVGSLIKVDGGYGVSLLKSNSGASDIIGLQYFKIVSTALTAEEVDEMYQKHSAIDYANDKTQYDNKIREIDEGVKMKRNEWLATTSGTGAAYTVTLDPAPETLYTGMIITIIPHITSTSVSATLDVNGLGAKSLRRRSPISGSTYAPYSATFLTADKPVTLIYDGVYWIVLGQDKSIWADVNDKPSINKLAMYPSWDHISNGLLIGSSSGNIIYAETDEGGYTPNYSLVLGSQNDLYTDHCISAGMYNVNFESLTFTFGRGLYAGNIGQLSCGNYNTSQDSPFVVGIGSSSADRLNGFRVDDDGVIYAAGAYNSTGADYGETTEWEDGNPNNEDRRGLFAYLVGTKLRLATSEDKDRRRLGLISARPAINGDSYDDAWHAKYITDIFGVPKTHVVHYEAEYVEADVVVSETGEVITTKICILPERDVEEYILNPDYDNTQEYVPRSKRPEYSCWGFTGKIVTVDDGTCQVDGYCYPGENGIATACDDMEKGFYVMERLDDTHIRVLVK